MKHKYIAFATEGQSMEENLEWAEDQFHFGFVDDKPEDYEMHWHMGDSKDLIMVTFCIDENNLNPG